MLRWTEKFGLGELNVVFLELSFFFKLCVKRVEF